MTFAPVRTTFPDTKISRTIRGFTILEKGRRRKRREEGRKRKREDEDEQDDTRLHLSRGEGGERIAGWKRGRGRRRRRKEDEDEQNDTRFHHSGGAGGWGGRRWRMKMIRTIRGKVILKKGEEEGKEEREGRKGNG